ncbi:MAG TPA: MFS transporter [Desulfobacteraceae bacterium]|nr:MFS transporter [Desulfobacteraceae bacterium]
MTLDLLQSKRQKFAWYFFGIVSLSYLMVYFHRVAPAVVSDLLMAEFNLSGAVLGNLAAIYFYVYTLMQLPAGVLADGVGAKKTVFWGMMISGIGSLIFAAAPVLSLAYLGRILIGFGVSVIFVSMLKIVTEWFPERQFGTLSGTALFIGNSGAVLAATPLAYLVSIWGWRVSFSLVGGIGILAGILTLVLVKNRPSQLDLPSPNPGAKPQVSMGIQDVIQGLGRVMKNPSSWPPFAVFFGIYGSLMAFQGVWGLPFLVQQYGMERFEASSNLLIIAVGLVIGCPTIGYISDRIGKRKLPLLTSTLMYALCWIAMLAWPGGKPAPAVLPFLLFAMGFFASGFILLWACTKEVNPIELSGCAIGLSNMGGFLGAAVVQPLFGWALDKKWLGLVEEGVRIYPLEAWRFAFMLSLVILLATTLIGILIKEPEHKPLSIKSETR